MPTPKKGARLGGSPAHQKLILSNLAAQLIEHRGLTTTEAKAKMLRPYVEKLITKAKRGDQHARRTVMKKIPNKGIVAILFEELVPAMDSERAGGYTRLIRVGNRKGDNAPLMRIELVMEKVEKKAVVKAAEKTAEKAAEAAAAIEREHLEAELKRAQQQQVVTKVVKEYVHARPDLNRCSLDADGLRLWNAANAGKQSRASAQRKAHTRGPHGSVR